MNLHVTSKKLSPEFLLAQKQLALISDADELAILQSLAGDKWRVVTGHPLCNGYYETAFKPCDSRDGAQKDPNTRDDSINFIAQTEGSLELDELSTAIGEIGPDEHEQAMGLLQLLIEAGAARDVKSNTAPFLISCYRQCRAAVGESNSPA